MVADSLALFIRTVLQRLTRLQAKQRVARSLCGSWASCSNFLLFLESVLSVLKLPWRRGDSPTAVVSSRVADNLTSSSTFMSHVTHLMLINFLGASILIIPSVLLITVAAYRYSDKRRLWYFGRVI